MARDANDIARESGADELRVAWDTAAKSANETLPASAARPPAIGDNSKPLIRILAGRWHELATELEAALIASGSPLYQNSGGIVRPIVDEVDAADGHRTKTARLSPVTLDPMLDHASRAAKWERFSKTENQWIVADPPKQVAAIVLSRDGEWKFPRLIGVLTTPTIRPDGTILSTPGYDPTTRLLLLDPPMLPAMPSQPTRTEALAALAFLDGLLEEFPFADKASHAVALSGLITPVVRGALPVAPLHAITAPSAGSGKSYLVDIAATGATGRRCPVIAAATGREPGTQDDSETEKRLGSALLAGYPLLSIDNLNGLLRGDQFCQAIERPSFDIRVLGFSKLKRIESRATLFATGNNLQPTGDIVRRTLLCTIDQQIERPELREYEHDPLQTILADRGHYLAAVLTIVRAYVVAGFPNQPPPLASFPDWSRMVRGALLWLGTADPVDTIETARADDPEVARFRAVVSAWANTAAANKSLTAGELKAQAEKHDPHLPGALAFPELNQALLDVAGHRGTIDPRRLGHFLGRNKGRIIEGHRLAGDRDAKRKQSVWRLVAA